MNKITQLSPTQLQPHPEEHNIYGETNIDSEFLASIKEEGILQPIIVADISLLPPEQQSAGCTHFIVSGHRRTKAAQLAQIKQIPAIIRPYDNYDETVLHLTISNIQRVKTEAQMIKEYLTIKQKICQLGKLRKKSSTYNNTNYADDEFRRFAETLNINEDKPIDIYEVIREKYGYSEHKQKAWSWLYDLDKREKTLNRLRKLGMNIQTQDQLEQAWNQCITAYETGETSLFDAAETIKHLTKDLQNKLQTKASTGACPSEKRKVKNEKQNSEKTGSTEARPSEKRTTNNKSLSTNHSSLFTDNSSLFTPIQLPCTFSQFPAEKIGITPESEIDYIFNTKYCDIGIIRTSGIPVGIAIGFSGGQYAIDLNQIAKIIVNNI